MALNTHTYDGKLLQYAEESGIRELCNKAKEIPEETKTKCIGELKTLLQDSHSNQYINLILTARSTNIDSTNIFDAFDLLYLCSERYKECEDDEERKSFLDILRLQFIDMKTGSCPQGRTTRLFQVLHSFSKK